MALWGKTDEAMKIIDALKALYKERHMFPSFPGYLYVAMGDNDQAFEWFNRACEEKEPGLPVNLFQHPFVVDKLGTDPRWIELLHKTGLSSSERSRSSSLGLPPALTKSLKTSFQLNSVSPRSFQSQELSRKPEALASSGLEPEGTFEPTSASCTLVGMKSIRLSQHQIVGDYIRYDEVTRHKLKDFKQKIFSSLTKPTMARENYLIWAPPGSGKTFFVGQLAVTVRARAHYCELNLASVSEEQFRSALSSLDTMTDPVLCFVDEIDGRLNQSWPYSALLGSLDASSPKGAPRVFVMAGSSGSSLDELKVKMTKAAKGTDLLSRVAHGNEVQIPQMTTGDKILLTLGSLKQAGKQVGRVISEVEKVAVYYIVLQPDLNSPRRLREFAVRCVERVPMEEDRVKYDNLFSAGDELNKEFWMQAKSVAPQLINSFVQIEE